MAADETAAFYATLATELEKHPDRDMVIIAGGFNAVLTTDSSIVLYSPSQAKANQNSEQLTNFLEEQQLIPANCRFAKPNYVLNTFHGPNSRKQRLDYILVPKKWGSTFYDCTTKRPPYSSDHKILIAYGKFRLKRHQKIQVAPRTDWSTLRHPDTRKQISSQIQLAYKKTGDANADYNHFVQISKEICNGLPTISRKQRTHPWEDKRVCDLRAKLQECRKQYRARPNKRNLKSIRRAGKNLAEAICYKSGGIHHTTMRGNRSSTG